MRNRHGGDVLCCPQVLSEWPGQGSVCRAHRQVPVDSAPSLGPRVPVLALPGPPPGGMLTLARGRLFHWHLDLLLVSRRHYKETRLLDLSGVGNNSLSGFVKRFEIYGHKGLCEELVFVLQH